jgi:hypothetical protein
VASSPASVGPTMVPTDETTTAGPTRRGPPSSASQAAPAVHSIPKDTPYTARPASSAAKEPPHASRHPATSSTPEAIVTRRAPNRSESIPTGIATASVAIAGSASTNADAEASRPNLADIRGSSGTIAVWLSPETKNRTSMSRVVPTAAPGSRRRTCVGMNDVDGIVETRYDQNWQVLHDGFDQL